MTPAILLNKEWLPLPDKGLFYVDWAQIRRYDGPAIPLIGPLQWENFHKMTVLGVFESFGTDSEVLKTGLVHSPWAEHLKTPFAQLSLRNRVQALAHALELAAPPLLHVKALDWLPPGLMEQFASEVRGRLARVLWEGFRPSPHLISHIAGENSWIQAELPAALPELELIQNSLILAKASLKKEDDSLFLEVGEIRFSLKTSPQLIGLAGKELLAVLHSDSLSTSFKEKKSATRIPILSHTQGNGTFQAALRIEEQILWVSVPKRPPIPACYAELLPEKLWLFSAESKSRVWPSSTEEKVPSDPES